MPKIMLVEDDKSLREIYSIRLVAEGYNIVSANDGEEGLQMAVEEKPDLIISDVMMPKISGFDMLDILRSTPETANIKIIMMTALSSEEQRQRGENLGADRYLVKSQVGIEDVVNTVHEVLGDRANANAQSNLEITKTIASIPSAAAPAPAPAPAAAPAPAPAAPAAQAAEQPAAPAPQPAEQPAAPAPTPEPAAPEPAPQVQIPHFTPEQLQGYVNEGRITAEQAEAILKQQTEREAAQNQAAPQAGEQPANFNQAPVATPAVVSDGQPVQTQPAAGAPSQPTTPASYSMPMPPSANTQTVSMPATVALPMPPSFAPTPTVAPAPAVQAAPTVQAAPVPVMQPNPQATDYYVSSTTVSPVSSAVNKDYLDKRDIGVAISDEEIAAAKQTQSLLRGVERIAPGSAPVAQTVTAQATAPNQPQESVVVREGRSGKRVIRPLNSVDVEARRAEMERQMSALLGETEAAKSETAANAAPTPTPEPVAAPTPETVTKAEAESEANLELDDFHALDGIQAPALSEKPAPSIVDEASIRQLANKEAAEVAAAKEEIDAKKAAEEEPEVVEAIQPGYITDLAEQINEDADSAPEDGSMAALMAQELVDDDFTRAAEKMREEEAEKPTEEKEEGFLENNEEEALPEFLKEDLANLGPNIVADSNVSEEKPEDAAAND